MCKAERLANIAVKFFFPNNMIHVRKKTHFISLETLI